MHQDTVELTKTRSVLKRTNDNPPTFDSGEEDDARVMRVFLDPHVYADMGAPELITVTIRPGDRLNP